MKYRADIDGLRSLAIIPVLFYHADLPPFNGGFAGVDVFFVISGFLITGIISEQLTAGSFKLSNFYERRLRRLIPALYFLLLLTFSGGLFFLMPEDLMGMVRSGLTALIFGSNFYFLQTTDYFSQAAELRPLLHTWSLAVEEQFYLFWPLLIAAFVMLRRAGKNRLAWAVSIGFLMVSFSASVVFLAKTPLSVFYIIVFRLWELGLGGLVALFFRYRSPSLPSEVSMVMYGFGFVLVLGSMIQLSSESPFPGLNAVAVVVGTGLMIFTGAEEKNVLASVFRWVPLVYVGKISYGLYLFHWPIFSYYRNYQESIEIDPSSAVMLLAVSFLFAVFSYHFVESPLRRKASKKTVVTFSAVGAVAFVTIFSGTLLLDGLPHRVGDGQRGYAKSRAVMNEWPCNEVKIDGLPARYCVFGAQWESADTQIVLWGDSHAKHFAPLIDHVIDHTTTSVLLYPGVPFIDDNEVRRWNLGANTSHATKYGVLRNRMMRWLNEEGRPDMIIIAAAWTGYPTSLFSQNPRKRSLKLGRALVGKGMSQAAEDLPHQVKTVLLSDFPRPAQYLTNCLLQDEGLILRKTNTYCEGLPRETIDGRQSPTTDILKSVADRYDNVEAVDVVDRFCTKDKCDTFIGGRLLYMDTNHIRRNLNSAEKELIARRLGLFEIIEAVSSSP